MLRPALLEPCGNKAELSARSFLPHVGAEGHAASWPRASYLRPFFRAKGSYRGPALKTTENKYPTNHGIIMVSGMPLVLGLRTSMWDPCIHLVLGGLGFLALSLGVCSHSSGL